MQHFSAVLEIIGVNPFVALPEDILAWIFDQAGRQKGPIPVRGTVNDKPYRQTLVRFAGAWRLYINMVMLPQSPKRIGEVLEVSIEFDPEPREVAPPELFLQALQENPLAAQHFEALIPSRKLEIVRYLANLKSETALQRNVAKIIRNLSGEGDFFGRNLTGK